MMRYLLATGVRWSVERTGVLVAGADGRARRIAYPEAAVWDLTQRGHAFAKVVSLTARIASVSTPRASRLVKALLEEWSRAGYLVQVR